MEFLINRKKLTRHIGRIVDAKYIKQQGEGQTAEGVKVFGGAKGSKRDGGII